MKYRGYDCLWLGPQDRGHWEIYRGPEFLGTADDGELDREIKELEEDD